MKFEWDSNKEKINIKKHKLDFSTAALVFKDENRLEFYDLKHSENEDRFYTIGEINEALVVITVIYTERQRDVIRIISARVATTKEREMYYGNN